LDPAAVKFHQCASLAERIKRNFEMATFKQHVVILGGGFGGLYAALEFEKALRFDAGMEVTLINRDNFILFTPMLHEVASSDIDIANIVVPIRKLLKRVSFIQGEVSSIDIQSSSITIRHGADGHQHVLQYDQLVLALGSVTNFFGIDGLEENGLSLKSLSDAQSVRNRLIANLEEANFECRRTMSCRLLTFVVAGGGFAGVETIAAMNDFARSVLRYYPNIKAADLRFVLVHPGNVILPELGESLGAYTQRKLSERNIEIICNKRVAAFSNQGIVLNDGLVIESNFLLWTAGIVPSPLIGELPFKKEKGRLSVDEFLQVLGTQNLWAIGDCAAIPDPHTGRTLPPTAQHAVRQAKTVAANVLRKMAGKPGRPYTFTAIGQVASIGRRCGVASILGINFSGFIAWFIWRTIYLIKLPQLDKKIRVGFDWTMDLIFSRDLVQFNPVRAGPAGYKRDESEALNEIDAYASGRSSSRSQPIQ
jgi:NADH dehydrogenase